MLAVGIVLAASLCGMWAVPLFFPRERPELRWQFLIGAALGVGLLSLLVLGLGLAGQISRTLWLAMLSIMGLLGLVRLVLVLRGPDTSEPPVCGASGSGNVSWIHLLLILLIPFAALWLVVAAVPPGVLWAEEAHGYDVLEYHLQVPKEYYLNGRITYLQHNIYSNFPMNAELLYLLAMVLKRDPIEAAILAQFFNVMLAALFVLAAWLAGREYHPAAGVVCALLAGSSPWIMFLCGLAYVENGMLFFGMAAAACLCWYDRQLSKGQANARLVLLAGVFAGFSCGFKYTAVPMIALPLLAALWLVCLRRKKCDDHAAPGASQGVPGEPEWDADRHTSGVLKPLLLFGLGAAGAISPWLIKNTLMTSNPVFPLGCGVFGARSGIWTDELAQRWAWAHQVEPEDAAVTARLARFAERVLLDSRLGWWMFVPIVPILIIRTRSWLLSGCHWRLDRQRAEDQLSSRSDFTLLLVLILQITIWLTCTHLFARFAVVMLIPLCLLAGWSVRMSERRWFRSAVLASALVIVGVNLFTCGSMYAAELTSGGEHLAIHGRIDWFCKDGDADQSSAVYLRRNLRQTDRVLMIGDARAFYMPSNVDYCVVFNRNPFAEAVAAAETNAAIIHWLHEHGYTHLLVHWSEMARLRRTYGFWDELAPELFRRLESEGLVGQKQFCDETAGCYSTLYRIPRSPN